MSSIQIRTDAAKAGIGLGSAIAVAISWSLHKSILWAAIFFFFVIRGGNRHSVDARLGKEF